MLKGYKLCWTELFVWLFSCSTLYVVASKQYCLYIVLNLLFCRFSVQEKQFPTYQVTKAIQHGELIFKMKAPWKTLDDTHDAMFYKHWQGETEEISWVFCLVPKLGNYYPSCPFPTTGTLRWTARVKSSCYLVFSLHGSFPGSATNPKHTVEVTGSWFLLWTKITMNQKGALWRKLNTDWQGNFVFHIMGEACLILSMGG